TDVNNCSKSAMATITVNPIPGKPTITPSGLNTSTPTLTSSSSSGNQWFDNGTAIAGAINQTYHATTSGSYTVQVTSNGCTGPLSDAYALAITGIEAANSDALHLYPNPVDHQLNIEWGTFTPNSLVEVRIYDLLGRLVSTYTLNTNEKWLEVGHLSTGQFIFQAIQGNQLSTQRFIKK
ncbi:MAG TPA: hypothetical protein DGG95_00605, partial [Cytophagales bacterium]|nr:hypothetical protein [Cytophagales bacterium]